MDRAALLKVIEKNRINLSAEGLSHFLEQMKADGWTLYGRPVEKRNMARVLREFAKKHPQLQEQRERETDFSISPMSDEEFIRLLYPYRADVSDGYTRAEWVRESQLDDADVVEAQDNLEGTIWETAKKAMNRAEAHELESLLLESNDYDVPVDYIKEHCSSYDFTKDQRKYLLQMYNIRLYTSKP